MRVLRDLSDRITGVINDDFLCCNEDTHSGFKSFRVELAVGGLELEQIQRRQIAGGVIEKKIFAAGIGRILPASSFAGVPFVNRGIELHSRIAADVGAFRDFPEQCPRFFAFARLSIDHPTRPPFPIGQSRFHEFIAHAHA